MRLPVFSSSPARLKASVGAWDVRPTDDPGYFNPSGSRSATHAPNGRPWVIAPPAFRGEPPPGLYLDTEGQWWMSTHGSDIFKVTPGGSGWFHDLLASATETLVPLAFEVVKFFPPIGTVAYAAYKAANAISGGRRLSAIAIEAIREQAAAGSELSRKSFDRAFEAAANKAKATAIDELRKQVLNNDAIKRAFDIGTATGYADAVQKEAIAYASANLSAQSAAVLQTAMENGGSLLDAVYALGGNSTVKKTASFIEKKSAEITSAPSNGGSSSVGLGTYAVLGGIGYLGVKFGPHILASLFNKRPKR